MSGVDGGTARSGGDDIQQLMQAVVARRFGAGHRPDAPIQFLSDNGSIYTALDVSGADRSQAVALLEEAARWIDD
jgi:transposase InsO family protein